MRGMFSLIVTVVLGYMIWNVFAPPIMSYMPHNATAGMSNYVHNVTGSVTGQFGRLF